MKKLLALLLTFGLPAYADLSPLSVSATAIQGFTISATAPANDDCLKYSTGTSSWFPSPCGGGGGGGTVTSVAMTVPAFLSVAGSPVTTSGTLALTFSGTAIPIANGGTGATTATSAFNNLAPSQATHSGKFLTTDGTNTSWATVSSSVPDPLLLGDGSAAAPSYSFTNATGSGMWMGGSGHLIFGDDGFNVLAIVADSGGSVRTVQPTQSSVSLGTSAAKWQDISGADWIRMDDGSVSAPSYSWTSNSDTGMWLAGSEIILGVNADNILTIAGGGIKPSQSSLFNGISGEPWGNTVSDIFLAGVGSAATPSYAINGDTDTGMYQAAANIIGFSTGGVGQWTMSATSFSPVSNNVERIGDATHKVLSIEVESIDNNGVTVLNTANHQLNDNTNSAQITFSDAGVINFNSNNLEFTGNIFPATDDDVDVGSEALSYSDGWFDGSLFSFQYQNLTGEPARFKSRNATGVNSEAVNVTSGTTQTLGDTGTVTVSSGEALGNPSDSGDTVIASGNANGGNGNSGDIIISTGTADVTRGVISVGAHLVSVGAAPTITANCGTGPSVVGTDQSGKITVGTGGLDTSCELTFNQAWTNPPPCVAGDESTSLLLRGNSTTTTLTITAATPLGAGDEISYICFGNQ